MTESLHILERLFQTAVSLDSLQIGFEYTKTCYVFFKMVYPSLHLPALHRLSLSRLKTRKAHIKTCLRPLKSTLKALCLEYIWFYGLVDDEPIAEFLRKELDLKEVTLRSLNLDMEGLFFRRVHKLRPKLRMYDARCQLGNDG
jgi:hypothetical protein